MWFQYNSRLSTTAEPGIHKRRILPFVNNEELEVRRVSPSQLLLHLHWLVSYFLHPFPPLGARPPSREEGGLDDWAVPVLGRDHDGDGPHAAEVGAGHLDGVGRGQRDWARRPLVLLWWGDLVVLGLQGVLVQVGGRHGAQGGALAAHGEAACRWNATLRRGHVLSERKHRQQNI